MHKIFLNSKSRHSTVDRNLSCTWLTHFQSMAPHFLPLGHQEVSLNVESGINPEQHQLTQRAKEKYSTILNLKIIPLKE